MEIDVFGMGKTKKTHYTDDTEFYKKQSECYGLNSVITKIASIFSNVEFTDGKSDNSLLVKKLNNPNNFQSKEEFLKEFAVFVLSCGYGVIWKRYSSYGMFDTLELINLNPDKIQINKESISVEYEDKVETIVLTDLIFFYDTLRLQNSKKGYSRITPLRSQVENILAAQRAKGIQIDNSGTTIVSPKSSAATNNVDQGLNAPIPTVNGNIKTQKEEMEDKLNSNGLSNRIIVSSKGLDAVNLSEKLNNVDFHKIIESDLLAIYDAFNFPIELSPYGKNAKYENKQVAEVSLLEKEVTPLMGNLMGSLKSEFKSKGEAEATYKHLNAYSVVEERIQKINKEKLENLKLAKDLGLEEAKAKEVVNQIYS